MSGPEIDPVTAESKQQDADIGDEHTEPTYRDQGPDVGSDEASPEGEGGPGGMDPE